MNYKTIDAKGGKEIAISGSFTFRDHDTFFEVVSLIKTAQDKKIVFNMNDCDFIDSAALGMFVIAHDEALAKNVDLPIPFSPIKNVTGDFIFNSVKFLTTLVTIPVIKV